MRDIIIVKINNPEKYGPFAKKYGILQDVLENTVVVNWNSNMSGICTNVSHGDYAIVPNYMWELIDGEVIINSNINPVNTGLKIIFLY